MRRYLLCYETCFTAPTGRNAGIKPAATSLLDDNNHPIKAKKRAHVIPGLRAEGLNVELLRSLQYSLARILVRYRARHTESAGHAGKQDGEIAYFLSLARAGDEVCKSLRVLTDRLI